MQTPEEACAGPAAAQAAATSLRMSDMSAQMKDMRAQMEENEQLSILMAGLRGSNTNDDDWAGKDVVMQLISVSDADGEVGGRLLGVPARFNFGCCKTGQLGETLEVANFLG